MSKGLHSDKENTRRQLAKPSRPQDGKNWLRHGDRTEGAVIDEMLLTGATDVEMATALIKKGFGKKGLADNGLEILTRRVAKHRYHLSAEIESGEQGHNLPLRKLGQKWLIDEHAL